MGIFTISLKDGDPNMSMSDIDNSIEYIVFRDEDKNEPISLSSFNISANIELLYQVVDLEFTLSDLFFNEIGLYNTATIDTVDNKVILNYHDIQSNNNLRYMDVSFTIYYAEAEEEQQQQNQEELNEVIMKRIYIRYEGPPPLFVPGRPIYQKRKYCCPRVNPLPDNYETSTVKHRQTSAQRASQLLKIYSK